MSVVWEGLFDVAASHGSDAALGVLILKTCAKHCSNMMYRIGRDIRLGRTCFATSHRMIG